VRVKRALVIIYRFKHGAQGEVVKVTDRVMDIEEEEAYMPVMRGAANPVMETRTVHTVMYAGKEWCVESDDPDEYTLTVPEGVGEPRICPTCDQPIKENKP
jgi:hypothetical protein